MTEIDPKQTFPAPTNIPVYALTTFIDCLIMLLARLASDAVLDASFGWL
jgi:hypothetical protein